MSTVNTTPDQLRHAIGLLLNSLALLLDENDGPIVGGGWDNPWVQDARDAVDRVTALLWPHTATPQEAAAPPSTVTVNRHDLRAVLDYLRDTEAEHYDPVNRPDDVYGFALAIERQLRAQGDTEAVSSLAAWEADQ
jgi:hypothetical protein